jgi:hypothetical protein
MPITAECPTCGHKGPVPDHFKGKTVKCHECHNMFTITGGPSAAAGIRRAVKQKSNPELGSGMDLAGSNGVAAAAANPFDFDAPPPPPQPAGKSAQGNARKPAPTGKSAQGRPRPPLKKKKNLDPLPMGALIMGGLAVVMGLAAMIVASRGLIGLASVPVGGFGLLLAIGGVCSSLRSGWPVLVPILGLLVCLGSLPVGGYQTYKLIASGALSSGDEHAKKTDPDTSRKPDDTPATNPTTGPVTTQPTQPRKIDVPPPSPPDQFADARQGFRVGKVWVKVTGVETDVLRGLDGREVSKDKRLLIRLTIQNVSNNDLDYFSWATSPPRGEDSLPRLTDGEGAPIKWAQPDGIILVNQVAKAASIPAGQSAFDVLAFDLPPDTVNALKLELPGGNVTESGKLKLQMPKVMLDAFVKGNPGDGPPKPGDPRMAKFVQEQLAILQNAKTEAEKAAAIEFLGSCGKDAAVGATEIGRYLKGQPDRVRAAAADTLGKIGAGAKGQIPELRAALKDNFWKVQANAAKALSNMGPEAKVAVPDLLPLLTSKDEEVPGNARAAIQKLDPSKLPK